MATTTNKKDFTAKSQQEAIANAVRAERLKLRREIQAEKDEEQKDSQIANARRRALEARQIAGSSMQQTLAKKKFNADGLEALDMFEQTHAENINNKWASDMADIEARFNNEFYYRGQILTLDEIAE